MEHFTELLGNVKTKLKFCIHVFFLLNVILDISGLYRRLWSTHEEEKVLFFIFFLFFQRSNCFGSWGCENNVYKNSLMSSGKTCWFFSFVNVFSLFWGPSPRWSSVVSLSFFLWRSGQTFHFVSQWMCSSNLLLCLQQQTNYNNRINEGYNLSTLSKMVIFEHWPLCMNWA